MRQRYIIGICIGFVAATPVHGQIDTLRGTPADSPAWPIIGGVLGMGMGLVGGAVIGASSCQPDCGEYGAYGGMIVGGLLGELLLVPIGVHLGNRSRGNLAADFGVSTVVVLGGLGIAAATTSLDMLAWTAIAQLAVTVMVERGTSPPRHAGGLSLGIGPDRDLRLGYRLPTGR